MQCRRFDALKGREAFPDIHLCLIVCFVVCLRISMMSREAHGCLFFFFFFSPFCFSFLFSLCFPPSRIHSTAPVFLWERVLLPALEMAIWT
ncbi:hypothetical protein IWX50DRAFT_220213 [Phyllosticta citricarpa]|uniref:Transmembrane protein n=1 Tax=Phyllosticta citricarpa TaxID=55181 RepID=A0ABR1MRY4_9PEZI